MIYIDFYSSLCCTNCMLPANLSILIFMYFSMVLIEVWGVKNCLILGWRIKIYFADYHPKVTHKMQKYIRNSVKFDFNYPLIDHVKSVKKLKRLFTRAKLFE